MPFFLYCIYDIVVKLEVVEPEKHGYNINVRVMEKKMVMERKQRNGSNLTLEEVLVGDTSGIMYFTARNGKRGRKSCELNAFSGLQGTPDRDRLTNIID